MNLRGWLGVKHQVGLSIDFCNSPNNCTYALREAKQKCAWYSVEELETEKATTQISTWNKSFTALPFRMRVTISLKTEAARCCYLWGALDRLFKLLFHWNPQSTSRSLTWLPGSTLLKMDFTSHALMAKGYNGAWELEGRYCPLFWQWRLSTGKERPHKFVVLVSLRVIL